jgi:hypothetical protein
MALGWSARFASSRSRDSALHDKRMQLQCFYGTGDGGAFDFGWFLLFRCSWRAIVVGGDWWAVVVWDLRV